MKKFILILLSVFVFSAILPAFAAEKAVALKPAPIAATKTEAQTDAEAVEAAKAEDIKGLIETLESDTARGDLLKDLKLLLEHQAEEKVEEATVLPLTEQIGIRGFFETSVGRYETFLERNNLSGSLVSQAIGTVVILIAAAALLYLQHRAMERVLSGINRLSARFGLGLSRLRVYAKFVHLMVKIFIGGLALYTIAKVWGFNGIDHVLGSEAVRSILSTGLPVLFVVFLAGLMWEMVSIYLAHILQKADSNNQTRVKTLLPIIRNIFFAIFGCMFGLVLLSEIGINVTPLLAGAGVLGVAIGFGAQSMVKDFLSGFTIVIEDLVRVGDVVTLAGVSGSVEKITLRKIQLRDYNGSVFTIPYSEIKSIENKTKDFSFYVMDINIAYNSSIDTVVSVLKQVDEGMRKDDNFSFMILEPLEIAGLDKFADSSMVLKARIKTLPIRQWTVGREFNKRMKAAFDANGIEIPFPQRMVNVRSDVKLDNGVLAEVSD